MTNVNCLVIRRSSNSNSFGLRGIWVICENSRRVFSFAANDLDARAYQVGEFVPVPFIGASGTGCPAHELARLEGEVTKATNVPKFLALFNDTLADKWTAHRKAKAIAGVPTTAQSRKNPDGSTSHTWDDSEGAHTLTTGTPDPGPVYHNPTGAVPIPAQAA